MFDLPMCTHCKAELEYENFFFEDCSGDTVWFSAEGYCPSCHKNFRWEEKYVFSGCTEPECVDKED